MFRILHLILDMFPFHKLLIVPSNKHWKIFYSKIANLKQDSPNALYLYEMYRKFSSSLIPTGSMPSGWAVQPSRGS